MVDDARVLALPMTAAYFRLIVRRFGASPARRRMLLAGTGIDDLSGLPGDADAVDREITVATQLRQLRNLHAAGPAHFGIELGAALDGVTHGAAGAVAVTAPSLGAALDALVRYATVRTPFVDLRATRTAATCTLHVLEACRLGVARRAVLEMVLLSIQGVAEAALGRRITEAVFRMPAPTPRYARRFAACFHGEVVCAGREASVTLPAAWLALPCPLADPLAHRSACTRLETLRQRLAGDFVDAMVERVLEGGGDAPPTLAQVARRLRLSPRTLVRRLGARGTSFRVLVEEHRRRRASELLTQPELSVGDVAGRLGYDEPTNFARACRRWFGVSPRAYRAQQRVAPIAGAARLG